MMKARIEKEKKLARQTKEIKKLLLKGQRQTCPLKTFVPLNLDVTEPSQRAYHNGPVDVILQCVTYRIQFAKSAEDHFGKLTARQQTIVLDIVKVQLQYEPLQETRNRKRLRPNPLAPWELRVGALRVFYDVDTGDADLVNVLAIGIKRGNQLFVAGKEIVI